MMVKGDSIMEKKLPISAIILTYNEELNIKKCLDSVLDWADEIIIVDSYSTDKTLEIAKLYTEKIYQNKYDGHPQQWQWTLKNVPIKNEWVFAIDADFIITEELWKEIAIKFAELNEEISGFYVRHKEVFKARPILHGGVYPSYWLRIFKKDKVRIDENELVDVHFYVNGRTENLEFDLIEQNYKDENIFFWIEKQNKFAKRHAIEEINRRDKMLNWPVKPNIFGSPGQRKLFFKNIYYKLPLYVRPFLYLFYRYILKLGFLDGKEGFIYHFTQGFFYRMLVDINIDEILSQRKNHNLEKRREIK
jgi:glycosyltransferase involved in cell wall biosynthesis